MDKSAVIILGAGGHAKVLLDCLKLNCNITVLGIVDIDDALHGECVLGIPILGDENEILKHTIFDIKLVNGLGSIAFTKKREAVFLRFKKMGYYFLNVIHPTVYLGEDVTLGEGVQIMAGCIVQPGCRLGDNVIVNTHVVVEHDTRLHDHVHLAPGVVCCGNVSIGARTHVGCGAIILQGKTIGEDCLIAAGAVVTRPVLALSKVAGIPAEGM